MDKGSFISREEATLIQGVAVMLMVFHHLFAFPERVSVSYALVFEFELLHIETLLSYFGRICVSIFAFLSGYGLYKKMSGFVRENRFSIIAGYKSILRQMLKFIIRYWLVLTVFITAGYFLNVYMFDGQTLAKHFLGLSSAYNAEWWYVRFYLELLLVFPLLYWAMRFPAKWLEERWSAVLIWISVLVLSIGWDRIDVCYLSAVTGMMCAGTGLFEWAAGKMSKVHGLLTGTAAVLLVGVILLRTRLGAACDFLFASVFVFAMGALLKTTFFQRSVNVALRPVGRYATYIWLTHTFFAYYYFQELVYAPNYSWLIFGWCMILSMIPGIILEPVAMFLEMNIKKPGVVKGRRL